MYSNSQRSSSATTTSSRRDDHYANIMEWLDQSPVKVSPLKKFFPAPMVNSIIRSTPRRITDRKTYEEKELFFLGEIINKQLAGTQSLRKDVKDNIKLAGKYLVEKGSEAIKRCNKAEYELETRTSKKTKGREDKGTQMDAPTCGENTGKEGELRKLQAEMVEQTKFLLLNGQKLKDLQRSIWDLQLEQSRLWGEGGDNIKRIMEENKIIMENTKKIDKLRTEIQENIIEPIGRSYADVAAAPCTKEMDRRTPLHSIMVTSRRGSTSCDEILEQVKCTLNTNEGYKMVENARKTKDRRVVISCKTKGDRDDIKDRLKGAEGLIVEDAANKKPLVVLKYVREESTEAEIQKVVRTQNPKIFENLSEKDCSFVVLFKKKTRDPAVSHIVARVGPLLWQRLIGIGYVHFELQKIIVEDQSPLVQCSMCLGYGHSKRLCNERLPKCSHCGGTHVRDECEKWVANTAPTCCNCSRAGIENKDHNAFSEQCPVRKRFDKLARSNTDYN